MSVTPIRPVTPNDALSPKHNTAEQETKTPDPVVPSSQEIFDKIPENEQLARQYYAIVEAIETYYIEAIHPSETRRGFAQDVILYLKSLSAMLSRINGPINKDSYQAIAQPLSQIHALVDAWQDDKVATTRDIHEVANKVVHVIGMVSVTYDGEGNLRRGMRHYLASMLA